MASRRELDKLLRKIDKAEDDQQFAAQHGYDAAFARKRDEVKALWEQHRRGLAS
jgi:hypothetical protein